LTRRGIRAAALALVDRDGLEGLSMRKLAQELEVQAASLYSHYKTKDELLADIANEIMADVDVSGFSGGDWRHGLVTWARSYRAALAAHPNLVPVIAVGPRLRDQALQRADAIHGVLVWAGWPRRHAAVIGASTQCLAVGAAINSSARGFSARVRGSRDRYPRLVPADRLAAHAAEIDAESFELALESFLAGRDRL